MSVLFDQLRISDDGKQLFINAHVNTAPVFNSYYMDEIIIMTADEVMESADPFCASPDDYVYYEYLGNKENRKELNMVLTPEEMDVNFPSSTFSNDLLFVYIKCVKVGTVDPCIEYLPCSLTTMTSLGVTFDENMLYQKVMDYTKQLGQECTVPQGFTDFILQWNAFKAAVETEHYKPAIKYWRQLFDMNSGDGSGNVKGCGCHG